MIARNHPSPLLAEFRLCLESISGIIAHRRDGGWIPVDTGMRNWAGFSSQNHSQMQNLIRELNIQNNSIREREREHTHTPSSNTAHGSSGVARKRRSKIAKIVRDDIPDIRGKMPGIAGSCCESVQLWTTMKAAAEEGDGKKERRPNKRWCKKLTLLVVQARLQLLLIE